MVLREREGERVLISWIPGFTPIPLQTSAVPEDPMGSYTAFIGDCACKLFWLGPGEDGYRSSPALPGDPPQ